MTRASAPPEKKLTRAQITARARELSGWTVKATTLRKTYRFRDFKESMWFVKRVATLAERAQHHPDIEIHYSTVVLALTTHDAGGISSKDFSLAANIDRAV